MDRTLAAPPASPVRETVLEPRLHQVQCLGAGGLHRMSYVEWGRADNPRVVICVHGLTRNGRDFDFLGRAMSRDFRVVCPDVVGRGKSDWLRDKRGYTIEQYMADMVTLIARLDVPSVSWVGTSMGGVIGMALAGDPATPITRLVLNDIGPVITAASIQRIAETLGATPHFATLDEAEAWIRKVGAPFGRLSDAQWRHLTEHSVKPGATGFEMRYDPAIREVFDQLQGEEPVDLWEVYHAVRCPTLAIRGALSDLLERPALEEMARTGPRARTVEIAGVGHAPMLMDEAQIALVRDFLCEED